MARQELIEIKELLKTNMCRQQGEQSAATQAGWSFKLIATESDLLAFEDEIASEPFKTDLISKIVAKIGAKPNTARARIDCAYALDKIMLESTFWCGTAWTGSRQKATAEEAADVKKKFAFCKHAKFIAFFNQLLMALTGSIFTDDEMKQFVQGRTRNSSYERTTDRTPAARSRAKKLA